MYHALPRKYRGELGRPTCYSRSNAEQTSFDTTTRNTSEFYLNLGRPNNSQGLQRRHSQVAGTDVWKTLKNWQGCPRHGIERIVALWQEKRGALSLESCALRSHSLHIRSRPTFVQHPGTIGTQRRSTCSKTVGERATHSIPRKNAMLGLVSCHSTNAL